MLSPYAVPTASGTHTLTTSATPYGAMSWGSGHSYTVTISGVPEFVRTNCGEVTAATPGALIVTVYEWPLPQLIAPYGVADVVSVCVPDAVGTAYGESMAQVELSVTDVITKLTWVPTGRSSQVNSTTKSSRAENDCPLPSLMGCSIPRTGA